MKGIYIALLSILLFAPASRAQDSFAADTVDIESVLYVVVGGDTVGVIGNVAGVKEAKFTEPPNSPKEIYLYGGAFFLPDSGATDLGAIRDTLFTSSGGTLPVDEYLVFSEESKNYRRAYISLRLPRGLHSVDSLAVLTWTSETDEDSAMFNISKLAFQVPSDMATKAYGATQHLRYKITATANLLQRVSLTTITNSFNPGDIVHLLIERLDPDSNAEDADINVWAIILYWH